VVPHKQTGGKEDMSEREEHTKKAGHGEGNRTQLDLSLRSEENVSGLDITVDNPLGVHVLESLD